MTLVDLGIADVHPLAGVAADPDRWLALRRRMNARAFLRSEGNLVAVGTPQRVSGALLAKSREVVTRFNRFYADVAAAYYTHPDLRGEHLVNPLLDPLLEIDAAHPTTTPLSRFDAVLEPGGGIRVIELNSVGVCLIHMRGLFYAIRELSRGGFEEDARTLDTLTRETVASFTRYAAHRHRALPKRPVIGCLTPSGWFRAGQLLFRAAFQRHGCDYVYGGPEHVKVTAEGVELRGTKIDILWADFFFYIAYQCARYQETKFPSKMPDFGKTPDQAAELLANKQFLAHLRDGRVVNISSSRAYLALPKSLLGWIHRSDRPIHDDDRAFLAEHVARTYGSIDRADGMITLETVAANRGEFLIKPCQYGASHGVELGCMTAPDAWRARLVDIWDDPSWAVQEFHTPVKTAGGAWVSLGLSNFDGALGGIYLRTADSLLINARDAAFIPAVPG